MGNGIDILFFTAMALVILGIGCCGLSPSAPPASGGQEIQVEVTGGQNDSAAETQNAQNPGETAQQNPPTGEGTIVDVGGSLGGNGNPAATQEDCATMTPTCADCIAKAGCGWCKNPAGCYKGDSSGPSGTVSCQPGDWALSLQQCQAPAGGSSCSSKTNCADCLSGSGCQWCISGTVCADAGAGGDCGSGGWKTKSYECYAGR
jgi:hypothetical protein